MAEWKITSASRRSGKNIKSREKLGGSNETNFVYYSEVVGTHGYFNDKHMTRP